MLGLITRHDRRIPAELQAKAGETLSLGKDYELHWSGTNRKGWIRIEGGRVTIQQDVATPPVYIASRDDQWIFSDSREELKLFIGRPTLDHRTLLTFLSFLHPALGQDWWEQTRMIPPGSARWEWNDGVERWDFMPFAKREPIQDEPRASVLLEAHLRSGLDRLVPRDKPVGLMLSGGMDSSLLACLLKEAGHDNIVAISVQFEGEDSGEVELARRLAGTLGFPHVHEIITAKDLEEELSAFLRELEEPCGIPSLLATVMVSNRARRRGIDTLVSGLGSDELFGGHRKHLLVPVLPWLESLPRAAKPAARALAKTFLFGAKKGWALRALDAWGEPPARGYAALCAWLPEAERRTLLSNPMSLEEMLGNLNRDLREVMMETDVHGWLQCGILSPLLKILPSHGTELILPFCTQDMLALANRLSVDLKVRLGRGKALLRRLSEKLLPPGLGTAPKGFVVPIGRWMAGPLKPFLEAHLTREAVESLGALRWDGVRELLKPQSLGKGDRSEILFALLTLTQWHEASFLKENVRQKAAA